jgi:hypothetical protein
MNKNPKTFPDGYIDGWHSIRPGDTPAVPSHATPAGKTPYEYGYGLGKQRALEFNGASSKSN